MTSRSALAWAPLALLALSACPGPAPADGGDAATDGPTTQDVRGDTPGDARGDVTGDATRDAGNAAGRPCMDDTMCAGNGGYTCDHAAYPNFAAGLCSAACTNEMAQADEQRQCGGRDTTCLTFGIGQTFERSACTRVCTVGTSARSPCAVDQICTTWVQYRGGPDSQGGCAQFCHEDAECAAGQHCDRRGQCRAAAIDMTKLPDGQPCNPQMERAGMPSPQCRGYCVSAGPQNTQGLCGGFMDRRRPPVMNADGTSGCYDNDPQVVPRGSGSRDDMLRCLWRSCFCNAECPTGLICSQVDETNPEAGGVCTYRNTAAMPAQVVLTMCPDAGAGDAGRDATAVEAGPDAAGDVPVAGDMGVGSDTGPASDTGTASDASGDALDAGGAD